MRLVLVFFGLAACVPHAEPRTAAVVPAERDVLAEVEALGGTDRAQAIAMIEAYLDRRLEPAEEARALLWAGEQRRLAGDDAEARASFVRILDEHPTDPRRDGATLGIALLDAKVSLSGNTLATLGMIGEAADIPRTMHADRFRLLARVAADDGSPARRVEELAQKALSYAGADPTVLARVHTSLDEVLVTTDEPEEEAPADTPAAALVRARGALADGDEAKARELATDLTARWPETPEAKAAAYVVRLADADADVDADKVAVLLPLSGDWAATGGRLREVVQMANDRSGRPMELVFADTQGKPDVAVARLEELVIEGGAIAVLGPLLKDEALAAGPVAEALQVPMVSLSQSEEVTAAGPWVFRGFVSMEEQVRALLDEAVTTRGMRRFAILYPLNPYGQNARDAFAIEAEKRGATIAKAIGYEENATDFLKVARDLGEKDDPTRASEWYQARNAAKRSGADVSKATIPPRTDFDAIFIPDNHRRVPLVASALAYEEFPVGSFRPHREDRPIVLLGLNAWNQETFPRDGGRYVQNCLFVDAFRAGDEDPAVQAFASDYQGSFHRPPLVVDAVAYDAARLLGKALVEADGDRADVQKALGTVHIEAPVAGGTSFADDRSIRRAFHVLTVSGDVIQEALPPGMEGLEAAAPPAPQ